MNYDVIITTLTRLPASGRHAAHQRAPRGAARVSRQLEAGLFGLRHASRRLVSSGRDACRIAVSMLSRLVETR